MQTWHLERKMLKFRWGNVSKWRRLGELLQRHPPDVIAEMLEMQMDLMMRRKTFLLIADFDARLGAGAAALCCRLELAHRTEGIIIFRDVARTVAESLMRRNVGLRSLPANRARNLLERLMRLHVHTRGVAYHLEGNELKMLEVLRARAADRTIMARWRAALLSQFPRVRSLRGLVHHWNAFANAPEQQRMAA